MSRENPFSGVRCGDAQRPDGGHPGGGLLLPAGCSLLRPSGPAAASRSAPAPQADPPSRSPQPGEVPARVRGTSSPPPRRPPAGRPGSRARSSPAAPPRKGGWPSSPVRPEPPCSDRDGGPAAAAADRAAGAGNAARRRAAAAAARRPGPGRGAGRIRPGRLPGEPGRPTRLPCPTTPACSPRVPPGRLPPARAGLPEGEAVPGPHGAPGRLAGLRAVPRLPAGPCPPRPGGRLGLLPDPEGSEERLLLFQEAGAPLPAPWT